MRVAASCPPYHHATKYTAASRVGRPSEESPPHVSVPETVFPAFSGDSFPSSNSAFAAPGRIFPSESAEWFFFPVFLSAEAENQSLIRGQTENIREKKDVAPLF
jgi:hypothetical protein